MRVFPSKWVSALMVALALLLSACAGSGSNLDRASWPVSTTLATSASPVATVTEVASSEATESIDPLPTAPITSSETSLTPTPTLASTPDPVLPAGCDAPTNLLQPEMLQAGSIGPHGVVRLPRVNDASPDPPNFAKDIYAWDNEGGEVGNDQYKAYFTAHTYSSDDTALGNQLIAQVNEGDSVRVTSTEGEVICYEVFERVEVLESEYIDTITGRPSQGVLVISVCSGLEGRDWTKRTIWFAQLVQPA